MDNIDQFLNTLGLTKDQSESVKNYFIDFLLDHLKTMKEEYDGEIDRAINSLVEAKNQGN